MYGRTSTASGVRVALISLGRGQSAAAEVAIDEGAKKGHWVCLSQSAHFKGGALTKQPPARFQTNLLSILT